MLTELKGSESASADFCVIDIENWPDGRVICIHTAWRSRSGDKGIKVERHLTWDTWVEWMLKRSPVDARFRTIYAHNGGGWDYLSLCEYLLRSAKWGKRTEIYGMFAASSMVALKLKIRMNGNTKIQLQLCDSLQLLRSPLDKLAKAFLGVGKVDLDGALPHEVFTRDSARFFRYCRSDVEHLIRVLEIALDTIRTNVAKIPRFGITIGATAMQVFRTIGGFGKIGLPESEDVREKLRLAYTGGRVECFRYGYYKDVKVYDVNSLYPYSMISVNVPMDGVTARSTSFAGSEIPGVYDVEWDQPNADIPAVMALQNRSAFKGRAWVFTPEIQRLLDVGASIKVYDGYIFPNYGRPFDAYVNRLYALRKTGDEALSLLCKFLLNSLYGKFGQRPERECICRLDEPTLVKLVQSGEEIRPIHIDSDVYVWVQEKRCKHEHVAIAGMITSRSRVVLHEGLTEACRNGDLLYCDTDSVHCRGFFGGLVGRELGQFKEEFSGEAVYAGKKLYALRNDAGSKVRAKGVSIGGRNGSTLCFDDLLRVVGGTASQCEFWKPSTGREILAGKAPACVFTKRVRTVRKT